LIFINFRALLDREGAWGIFYSVSSEEPKSFILAFRYFIIPIIVVMGVSIYLGFKQPAELPTTATISTSPSVSSTSLIWFFVTWYGSIGGHKSAKSLSGKRLN
jgi:hypothetical protein